MNKETTITAPTSVKKPYATPQLVVYGDLREITQAGTGTGTIDSPPFQAVTKT
jgi:hypothetical protein